MSKLVDLELGEKRLVVMTEQLKWDVMEKMAEAYADVKRKHSIFGQYPMLDGETVETWAARTDDALNAKNKKAENETYDEYLKRVLKQNMDKQALLKDTIITIAGIFGQADIPTDEGFKAASYPDCKEFVIKVFEALDLNSADFY